MRAYQAIRVYIHGSGGACAADVLQSKTVSVCARVHVLHMYARLRCERERTQCHADFYSIVRTPERIHHIS